MPVGASDFSLLQNVKTSSVPHPASSTVGTATVYWMVKAPGRCVDHPSLTSADVKNDLTLSLHVILQEDLSFYIFVPVQSFLGAFAKLRKPLLASSYPSVLMEQLGSQWTDFD
jgi:hypothetical protein